MKRERDGKSHVMVKQGRGTMTPRAQDGDMLHMKLRQLRKAAAGRNLRVPPGRYRGARLKRRAGRREAQDGFPILQAHGSGGMRNTQTGKVGQRGETIRGGRFQRQGSGKSAEPARIQAKKNVKNKPLKKIAETDAIFESVREENKKADEDADTIRISVDAKAKVLV